VAAKDHCFLALVSTTCCSIVIYKQILYHWAVAFKTVTKTGQKMLKIAAVVVTAKKENLSCNRYAKRGEKMLYDFGAISKC
jgi:hypothetical protein